MAAGEVAPARLLLEEGRDIALALGNPDLTFSANILRAQIILTEGNQNGEFDVEDIDFTAEMLQSAMMKFRYPQLWSNLKLPALEREFNGVARLLLVGLAGRAGTARECHVEPAKALASATLPPRDVAA